MTISDSAVIIPDWPAPANVRSACTTRSGGVSEGPWSSLNLGAHVGDNPDHVRQNRQRLADWVGLPFACFEFMEQIHGTDVVELPAANRGDSPQLQADACVTSAERRPCLVMTADCLPVLFCNRAGTRVAAAHAGWRGLSAGVLEQTVATFENPQDVMAWLGPAIGPDAFEVGAEVRDAFVAINSAAEPAFRPSVTEGRYLADLYELARQRLNRAGVAGVYGGHWCTFTDADHYFSFRRDGVSGRMASFIFFS